MSPYKSLQFYIPNSAYPFPLHPSNSNHILNPFQIISNDHTKSAKMIIKRIRWKRHCDRLSRILKTISIKSIGSHILYQTCNKTTQILRILTLNLNKNQAASWHAPSLIKLNCFHAIILFNNKNHQKRWKLQKRDLKSLSKN